MFDFYFCSLTFLFCFLDDFLNDLLWTGVKGKNRPKRTYLIASIKDNDGKDIFNERFKNTPFGKHAEKTMLCDGDFRKAVAYHHNMEIVLTLNYSPCSSCADDLKLFYETYRNIGNLTIQFSFLYNIQEEENQSGLRNLSNAGVTVQAMNANLWREVGVDLESMASEDERRISKRDKNTGDMLYAVL